MSSGLLPASLLAPALVRRVHGAGGFATILAKGSPWGGALVVVHRPAGAHGRNAAEDTDNTDESVRAFELVADLDGRGWRVAAAGEAAVARFCASQQKFDPDIWIVELVVGDIAPFIAEIAAIR